MKLDKLNKNIAELEREIQNIKEKSNKKIKLLKDQINLLSQKKSESVLKEFENLGLDKIPHDKLINELKLIGDKYKEN